MPVAVLPIVVFERLGFLVLVGHLLGDKPLGTAELEDVDELNVLSKRGREKDVMVSACRHLFVKVGEANN